MNGSDDAVDSTLFCELREFHSAGYWGASDSRLAHGFVIHAGEDGDCDQARAIRAHGYASADGLSGSLKHRCAAERMHVDELHSGHGGSREHRPRYGVGNIVKFQIEENAVAKRSDLLDGLRTGAGEQLVANLEHADEIRDSFGKLQSRRQRVEVQGYDQTAAGMSVEGHVFSDPNGPLGVSVSWVPREARAGPG